MSAIAFPWLSYSHPEEYQHNMYDIGQGIVAPVSRFQRADDGEVQLVLNNGSLWPHKVTPAPHPAYPYWSLAFRMISGGKDRFLEFENIQMVDTHDPQILLFAPHPMWGDTSRLSDESQLIRSIFLTLRIEGFLMDCWAAKTGTARLGTNYLTINTDDLAPVSFIKPKFEFEAAPGCVIAQYRADPIIRENMQIVNGTFVGHAKQRLVITTPNPLSARSAFYERYQDFFLAWLRGPSKVYQTPNGFQYTYKDNPPP